MQEDIKDILTSFFGQVKDNKHTTSHFPSHYSGLQMKVGFGVGRTAKIPWITFLGEGQKPQNGIFPVYYFFKEYDILVLAYGISEAETPVKKWKQENETKTVAEYAEHLGFEPHKYRDSYVYNAYDTSKSLDWHKIEIDLDSLIDYYKRILQ